MKLNNFLEGFFYAFVLFMLVVTFIVYACTHFIPVLVVTLIIALSLACVIKLKDWLDDQK
jgi:hypothetical protein